MYIEIFDSIDSISIYIFDLFQSISNFSIQFGFELIDLVVTSKNPASNFDQKNLSKSGFDHN